MISTYSNLYSFKERLGVSQTDTTNDNLLLTLLKISSRQIDTCCRRHFYPVLETRYYQTYSTDEIFLPDDITHINSLKTDEDEDGNFETFISSSDYIVMPNRSYYKERIVLKNGAYFPIGYKAVEIEGVFGCLRDDWSQLQPQTVTITDATTTSVTLSAAASQIKIGQTILVGDEFLYVTGNSSTTLTVERGYNSSTPAAATAGSALYLIRFNDLVDAAANIISARLWQNIGSEGVASESLGNRSVTYTSPVHYNSTSAGLLPFEENLLTGLIKSYYV